MTDEELYEYEVGLDDYSDEPVGSCFNCGVNVYSHEAYADGLCDQCQWFAMQNMPEMRASE